MRRFEASLVKLLNELEPLLPAVDASSHRWVLVRRNQRELRPARNESFAAVMAYYRSLDRVQALRAFQRCEAAFNADAALSRAAREAGYWGTFKALLQAAIERAATVPRDRVVFNPGRALVYVGELRRALRASRAQYQASARVLGLSIASRRVQVAPGLELVRLSRSELNAREPFREPHLPDPPGAELAWHPTEARARISVALDHRSENALFLASNDAMGRAREAFQRLENALLVVKQGQLELGPQSLSGGFVFHGTTIPHPSGPIGPPSTALSREDERFLVRAYKSVCGPGSSDEVLSRAVHRFAIARKRRSLEDAIVDLVVAWETVLLTEQGNAVSQELSYRFSLNGSSILHAASSRMSRRRGFDQMRAAYSVRSCLVHGAVTRVARELAKGEFADLAALRMFLEDGLRTSLFWLASVAPPKRPYRAVGGWHRLLWGQ